MKTAKKSIIFEKLGLRENNNIKKFGLVTLHHPSNVDNPKIFKGILNALNRLSREIQIIFPARPRTIKQIKNFKLMEMVNFEEKFLENELNKTNRNILTIQPLGYLDFLSLMTNAKIVFNRFWWHPRRNHNFRNSLFSSS